jgi:hypothetical protein
MTELEVFQKSLDVSRITLVVSIVLSVSSVVFAILGMAFQRSHNKKSVRPLCDLRIEHGESGLSLAIHNLGLGPMIIGKLVLRAEPGLPETTIAACLPGRHTGLHVASLRQGNVLAPGGSLVLLASTSDADPLYRLESAIGGRTLLVEYQDIYDRVFRKEESLKLGE